MSSGDIQQDKNTNSDNDVKSVSHVPIIERNSVHQSLNSTSGKEKPELSKPQTSVSNSSSKDSNCKMTGDTDNSHIPPKVGADLGVPDNEFGDEYTDRRLWIGNLDIRLTE